jgi:hypothetical protein
MFLATEGSSGVRTLANGSYDISKIEAILDLLVSECTAIAGENPGA